MNLPHPIEDIKALEAEIDAKMADFVAIEQAHWAAVREIERRLGDKLAANTQAFRDHLEGHSIRWLEDKLQEAREKLLSMTRSNDSEHR